MHQCSFPLICLHQFQWHSENRAECVTHRHWWLIYHKMYTSVEELPEWPLLSRYRLGGIDWQRRRAVMKWWIRAGEMLEGGEGSKGRKQLGEIRRVKIISNDWGNHWQFWHVEQNSQSLPYIYEYKHAGRGVCVFVCMRWLTDKLLDLVTHTPRAEQTLSSCQSYHWGSSLQLP